MIMMLIASIVMTIPPQADGVAGERPYEMVWANRVKDDHPPLIDFEDLIGWRTVLSNAEATFQRSREQQIWGKYVGKLTYRGTGSRPEIRILSPGPVKVNKPFDAVTCWIYGNNWAWAPDPETPQVAISALFSDAEGNELRVNLTRVRWKEWFLAHRRLTPDQIKRVSKGASFTGFLVENCSNEEDRVIYFDNLAVFVEEFPSLEFRPRPERGIPMFLGQTTGTNTGPGRLPFPTRSETILPDNITDDFKTELRSDGDAFVFEYDGADGKLTYRIEPKTGTLGDISAHWEDRGAAIQPCVDGGVYLQGEGEPVAPERAEHLGTPREGDTVQSHWRLTVGDLSAEVTYIYRLWGKSLVVDIIAPGGQVGEVRYGRAVGLETPRLVTNPYYLYGSTRPAVVVSGPPDEPLFLAGNTDWCLSNASAPWAENAVQDEGVLYNGGTRYIPKTDGKHNDCYERLFITISPRYEEVLPNVPNPKSPWKHVTGTRLWRAHGAGNRENDIRFWTRCHRYGMTQVVITDHETMWRDGGESFTFRTRAAPEKGGDEGAYNYARVLQDELGFVYGPYNNFTDFAPVNEYWHVDRVSRTPDNQLQGAWARCYAPKPARAVEFCEMLAPRIQEKFRFSTAYCDVHTAVAPWDRVDYDYRVPGAGTFAAVFYSFGEIMLLQKAAWNGPVYSEGNRHYLYCGLTDGNYGQDQQYRPATSPWLVDFDLRKIHDLCCNFGMGNPGMFYGSHYSLGRDRKEIDASIDRFLAATVAFGHTGFLTFEGGIHHALRSYYMLQQLHSSYALSSADEIRYADTDGNLLDTTSAVATGAYRRSQVVTRYANGCVTAVNGNAKGRMTVEAYGRELDLPPNGYAGWTEDGSIEVISADPDGHRCDYAATPAYIYVDGRDRFMRFEKAASNGIGICRILGEGRYEIIPYNGAECGFATSAGKATALDEARNVLGPAEIRVSRGLLYVIPVEGAFSYIFEPGDTDAKVNLTCDRDEVVAGESVVSSRGMGDFPHVRGTREHRLQIPTDAIVGDRLWHQFEGAWIDFTVVPLAYADVSLEGNVLRVEFTSNLSEAEDARLAVADRWQVLRLEPGRPMLTTVDLGIPEREAADILVIELRVGARHAVPLQQRIERGMRIESKVQTIASLPERWEGGMRLRGQEERFGFADTRAHVGAQQATCGKITKEALAMHPPWVGGVGYAFALYDPITLPTEPKGVFRAFVGKRDGSDPGDGILYKVAVVDAEGKETTVGKMLVGKHEWVPIEGDLSHFAGKTIRIKLISDVGENDNSVGDWACWAEARIETPNASLVRVLDENTEPYRREPGPFPVPPSLSIEDLHSAKSGWLHYDGMGLSGTGESYGSFAVLNGVELGYMAPAGGNESQNVWAENVSVPLTPEAVRSLSFRNRFVLGNPRRDYFKVRRFWIELELADGRKCSSEISTATYTQPPDWPHAEGIGVPFGEGITVDIWFKR
jgi:hypothetical protein